MFEVRSWNYYLEQPARISRAFKFFELRIRFLVLKVDFETRSIIDKVEFDRLLDIRNTNRMLEASSKP